VRLGLAIQQSGQCGVQLFPRGVVHGSFRPS
jgi:hypothetical protein